MSSILPSVPGIDINGLIYRYTTNKETDADMKVHLGNKNANGEGYLFRKTDNWSGVPGNTIVRTSHLEMYHQHYGAMGQSKLRAREVLKTL